MHNYIDMNQDKDEEIKKLKDNQAEEIQKLKYKIVLLTQALEDIERFADDPSIRRIAEDALKEE